MRFNLGILIITIIFLGFASQNCSRRIILQGSKTPVVSHHSVVNNFTHMRYTNDNLPTGSLDQSVSLDFDLLNHQVEIASIRSDGLHCTKTFTINPILTEAFQSTFHSMSYATNIESEHLFAGDSYMTLTNSQGHQDFVIDAAVVPADVAKVKDPQALYYLIQGLFYTDYEGTTESCL